jgi:hypothetical protein
MIGALRKPQNIDNMIGKVVESGVLAETMGWALGGQDLTLVIELPSPPYPTAGTTGHPRFFIPDISLGKLNVTFGVSGNGGVFFGLGVGTRDKSSQLVPKIPNYRNILRVDYMDYRGAWPPSFHGHFHAGRKDDTPGSPYDHHPLIMD